MLLVSRIFSTAILSWCTGGLSEEAHHEFVWLSHGRIDLSEGYGALRTAFWGEGVGLALPILELLNAGEELRNVIVFPPA